jgi:uncharacterized membrane protein YbhN (UPF0104 family)
LLAVVLVFVGRTLWTQFRQIDWSEVHFKPLPLLGAFFCLVAVYFVQMLSYRMLLRAYAHAPSWRAMATVAWVPPLGKYVPGKVASIASAIYLLRKFHIPAAVAVSVVLVMDGLAVLTGLITGSPLLAWGPVQKILPHGWLICLMVVIGGIICLHPAVYCRLINVVLRRTGRAPLERMPPAKHYVGPVACGFAQWALAGLALWLISRSLTDVAPGHLPLFVAVAGLGYTVSYLTLFAPGGLGVREAIFNTALVLVVGDVSAVVVVVMRIVQTLVEVGLAGVGYALFQRSVQGQPRATMP